MKNAMIIANSKAELNNLVQLSKLLPSNIELVYYLLLFPLDESISEITSRGFGTFEVLSFGKNKIALEKEGKNVKAKNKFQQKSKLPAPLGFIKSILQTTRFILFVRKEMNITKQILKIKRPSILIAAEGSPDYKIRYFIKHAKILKIPLAIFPYTFANWKEYFEVFKHREDWTSKGLVFRYIRRFDQAYYREYLGEDCIRFTPNNYIAMKLFGLLPERQNPWAMNCLVEKNIYVESEFLSKYFANSGILASSISVTGSENLDALFTACNMKSVTIEELKKSQNFNALKPTILCSIPPYQKRNLREYDDYDSFMQFFIEAIKVRFNRWNIIFKFHPRLSVSEVREAEERFSIKNSSLPTEKLISISDVYIASISATIRWALALKIPVINYDFYEYRYNDFVDSKNVYECFDKDLFLSFMDRASQQGFKWNSEEDEAYWGRVDGQSSANIQRELKKIINLSQSHPS